MILIHLKLPFLFRRTTNEKKHKNGYENSKKSKEEFEVRYQQRGGLGRPCGLLVYDTFEAHVTENVKVVFAEENSTLALIPCRLTSVL